MHTTADKCIIVIVICANKLWSFGKFTTNYLGTLIALYFCLAIWNALKSLNECDMADGTANTKSK